MLTSLQQNLALEAVLPALLVALAFSFLAGRFANPRMAGASIGLGVLASYVTVLWLPGFPPSLSMPATQKLAYVVAAATLIGLALDFARASTAWLPAALAALAALWIGWRGAILPEAESWAAILAATALAGAALPRLAAEPSDSASSAVALAVASIGMAAQALLAGSGALAQIAGALAAAAGGFGILNWPRARHPFGLSAILGGGVGLVAIGLQLALFAEANRLALALPFLALFAPSVVRVQGALRPVSVGLLATVPALAAWGATSLG